MKDKIAQIDGLLDHFARAVEHMHREVVTNNKDFISFFAKVSKHAAAQPSSVPIPPKSLD